MKHEIKVGPIRHAPWSKWFKTFYCHGRVAHELQFGPLVFQWFYDREDLKYIKRNNVVLFKLHIWKDLYWR